MYGLDFIPCFLTSLGINYKSLSHPLDFSHPPSTPALSHSHLQVFATLPLIQLSCLSNFCTLSRFLLYSSWRRLQTKWQVLITRLGCACCDGERRSKVGEGKLQRRREGMIWTDFRLWAKVQEGRGSPCMLRNLIAMGAESELIVSGGEHQHICRVGLGLLRDTGAKAKTSRTGRYVRGTSRPLCCAVTGAQTSCIWFVWLGLCTGTCGGAGVKSAVGVHIQWDRADGAPCAGRGSTAICSGPPAPQGPTWAWDVTAPLAGFLESCRIPCLSLEPLLCGCWGKSEQKLWF